MDASQRQKQTRPTGFRDRREKRPQIPPFRVGMRPGGRGFRQVTAVRPRGALERSGEIQHGRVETIAGDADRTNAGKAGIKGERKGLRQIRGGDTLLGARGEVRSLLHNTLGSVIKTIAMAIRASGRALGNDGFAPFAHLVIVW